MRISDWSSDVCSSDLVGRQFVEGAVQPAVPFGRHAARIIGSIIDHPAAAALFRAEIAVAEAVLADLLARAPAVQQRADGRAVPPGENLAQNAHGCAVYSQGAMLRKRQTVRISRFPALFSACPELVEGPFFLLQIGRAHV